MLSNNQLKKKCNKRAHTDRYITEQVEESEKYKKGSDLEISK